VLCLWFKSITSVVQRDWSLRGRSVTCVTYQCCPYKSVTSNSLLLEALCSMLGENSGESACKERQRTRLDPAENSLEMLSTLIYKLLPWVCCQTAKEKTEWNQQAAALTRCYSPDFLLHWRGCQYGAERACCLRVTWKENNIIYLILQSNKKKTIPKNKMERTGHTWS